MSQRTDMTHELKLYQRLEAFKRAHKLTDEKMSAALGTALGTYRSWKYRKSTPPAAVAHLLALFEQHPCVRKFAGAVREKKAHGKPFAKNNPWRFGDPRRSKYLETCNKKEAQDDET
jgi:hypothetical protein